MKSWIPVVCGTILCWGTYGILLHQGRTSLQSSYRAFLWVGIAYLIVAVFGPLGKMAVAPEPGTNSVQGCTFALLAGTVGALGALGAIVAFGLGGRPLIVMPMIFAGAPLVNTVITMLLHPPKEVPSPTFFFGILLAAGGTWVFMTYAPAH